MKTIQINIQDEVYESIASFASKHQMSFEDTITRLAMSSIHCGDFENRAAEMDASFEEESRRLTGYEARKARLLPRSASGQTAR